MTDPTSMPAGVSIHGSLAARYDEILTPEALTFVAALHRAFDGRRVDLLAAREERQKRYDGGELPDFLPETRAIRDGDWTVAPIPADLQDRRVEITGPVDRKMVINALNSGARMFMADFEDATSPTWDNMIDGQINLRDRWHSDLAFSDPASGKSYRLGDSPATLLVRARGWHLLEEHVTIDGAPVSGGLFDFGLYVFHNARTIAGKRLTPAFYLPKLESHQEAKLWDDAFTHAERALDLPHGTLKATVLIETLPATFELHEILHAMKDHIVALNCGRWDYIFSYIKRLGKNPAFLTPDRGLMGMGSAFLRAYSLLVIETCHRRGAFAMGGMAAQIPNRKDAEANAAAFAKVKADKEREAGDGHDGTWVAHPDLVPVAMEVFDRLMPTPNQVTRRRDDHITRDMLLEVHKGARTEAGLRENIRVGVQYIEAWLRGRGAVPLYNLMEDAATAEISRAQIWQWLRHQAELDDGRKVTPDLLQTLIDDEMSRVRESLGAEAYDSGRFPEALDLFARMSLAEDFAEFLTLPAYQLIK
jgi:malate synthase